MDKYEKLRDHLKKWQLRLMNQESDLRLQIENKIRFGLYWDLEQIGRQMSDLTEELTNLVYIINLMKELDTNENI